MPSLEKGAFLELVAPFCYSIYLVCFSKRNTAIGSIIVRTNTNTTVVHCSATIILFMVRGIWCTALAEMQSVAQMAEP